VADWIRRSDGDALVFFDATGLDAIDGEPDLDRPEGDFLVFAPHWYAPGVFSGSPDLSTADVEGGLGHLADLAEGWDLPLLLGEFGIQASTPGADDYLRRHYDTFDERGMHATLWEYSRSTERWNGEALSVIDVDGSETSTLGVAVRPYVRALAGSNTAFTWDPAAREVTLTYDATADGVTEVVLPGRALTDPRVDGTGACAATDGERLLLRADADGPVSVTIRPR
jgi:endoglycosylceramidase